MLGGCSNLFLNVILCQCMMYITTCKAGGDTFGYEHCTNGSMNESGGRENRSM